MRQQHHRFAHQVLRDALWQDPAGLWGSLCSGRPDPLLPLWALAAEGLAPSDRAPEQLCVAHLPMADGREALLIDLAPPVAPTECYRVALVRTAAGTRYFVMERGVDNLDGSARAFWAEWRLNGATELRLRGPDLAEVSARAFLEALELEFAAAEIPVAAAPGGAGTAASPPGVRTGLIVAGGLVTAVLGLGGYLLYQEELRGLHVPDDPVVERPFVSGQPFALEFTWRGTGYAFNNLWLIVDTAELSALELRVTGAVRCGSSPEQAIALALPGPGVQRLRRDGPRLSGWVYLMDEYTRRSPRPLRCTGTLTAVGGTVRGRLAVTQRQRPADFLHF